MGRGCQAAEGVVDAERSRWSASLLASAMIVWDGWAPPEVANTLASQMNRLGWWSQLRRFGSTTEVAGSAPMRQPPMVWSLPSLISTLVAPAGLQDDGAELLNLLAHGVLVVAVGERHPRPGHAVLVDVLRQLHPVLRRGQTLPLGAEDGVVRVGLKLVHQLWAPPAGPGANQGDGELRRT